MSRHLAVGCVWVLLLLPLAAGAAPPARVVFESGRDVSGSVKPSDKARLALLVTGTAPAQQKRLLLAFQDGPEDAADIVVRTSPLARGNASVVSWVMYPSDREHHRQRRVVLFGSCIHGK